MFNVQSQNEISAFLAERIEAGDFPSAVYLVGERGEIKFVDALGLAVKTNEIEIPAQLETIYDLASLTKPLVTGVACAMLFEQNQFALKDKVAKIFDAFNREDKREITIQHLIAHCSSFCAWEPFYLKANGLQNENLANAEKVFSLIVNEKLENSPGEKVKYSDLNFLTLGFVLEKIAGKSLNYFAEDEIFKKQRLTRTAFNPFRESKNEIAACEFGNEYEKQICREMNFAVEDFPWRKDLIWAEVHDGNCRFMNGVSGHAGLFSTAQEVFKIALQFLPNSTTLLKPETCDLFKTNFTPNLNEARSFGFELAATKDSTASNALAKNSFGHLGFTGTSLWVEPDTERIFILLTNRTHRPLPFVNINSVRRKFHELATKSLNTA